MKIFKYVLPWLMAAVLVLGSCMTVCAEDYTEEQLLEMRNETKNIFNEYFEENGISPKYMIYVSSIVRPNYGGYFEAYLYYSDDPFLCDGDVLRADTVGLYYPYSTKQVTSSSYGGFSVPCSSAYLVPDVIYSNHDIYYEDGETLYLAADTTGFFPKVPVLQKALKGTELTGVMKEILAMVPLLIPLLAGYLALRKALSLVSQTLRTA